MEIDHEIPSKIILLVLLIQEGLLSVTSEIMCTEYWLTLLSKLAQKNVVRLHVTDRLIIFHAYQTFQYLLFQEHYQTVERFGKLLSRCKGEARTLKKLLTSKGDYCIKQ